MAIKVKQTAPYASVAPFKEIFKKIRNLNFTEISTKKLKELGYKKFVATSSSNALKFLGLIDDSGQVTDLYREVKQNSKYKQTMNKIVRQAYKKAFEVIGESRHTSKTEDIVEAIFLAYPDTSKTTSAPAASLFLWLCSEADIYFENINNKQVHKENSQKNVKLKKSVNTRISSYSATPISININLNITTDTSLEDINSMLEKLRKAIKDGVNA